jgi:hypothetical protein
MHETEQMPVTGIPARNFCEKTNACYIDWTDQKQKAKDQMSNVKACPHNREHQVEPTCGE